MFVYFQTFEKVEVVESMYENIYGMVGGALCDHGYQLSVAYYNQAAKVPVTKQYPFIVIIW
jgi:hypothetical protein